MLKESISVDCDLNNGAEIQTYLVWFGALIFTTRNNVVNLHHKRGGTHENRAKIVVQGQIDISCLETFNKNTIRLQISGDIYL